MVPTLSMFQTWLHDNGMYQCNAKQIHYYLTTPIQKAPQNIAEQAVTAIPQQPICATGDAKLPRLKDIIDDIALSGGPTRTDDIIAVYDTIIKLGDFKGNTRAKGKTC